jgi:uncharacterized protein (DUF2225 family)
MTTMDSTTLGCPNCGADVHANVLMSTNYFGATTDLHRMTSGLDPLEFLVHSCEVCGFTGGESAFEGSVEPQVSTEIEAKIKPHLADEHLGTDTRWEFSALIAEWRKSRAEAIAQQYLNAAWTATSRDKENFYRRKAISWFETALEEGAIEEEQRPTIVYLVGELYRRVGDTAVAHSWFDRAIADADDPKLRQLAEQQKSDPQERIAG